MVLGTEVKPIAGIAIASSGASSACVEDGGSPAGPHLVPSEHRHASAAASAVSTAAAIPVSEPAASGVAERHTARRVASELCAAQDRVSHAMFGFVSLDSRSESHTGVGTPFLGGGEGDADR